MKKFRFLPLLFVLFLLSGCVQPTAEITPPQTQTPGLEDDETPVTTLCRIVDGADIGELLLAGEGEVYSLRVSAAQEQAPSLKDGMMVDVAHNGAVMETWPAQFGEVYSVTPTDDKIDDRCGLYLQVLEDLWEKDSGLNEGIRYVGMDLSGLTHLTETERSAVAWRFAGNHGLELLTGTFEELSQQGYIDKENLLWEDGVLFTITTDEDAVWSTPAYYEQNGLEPPVLTAFDAQKWRSGLGAYFFYGCCGQRLEDGSWKYSVSAEAIA